MKQQTTLADVLSNLPTEEDQRRLIDVLSDNKEQVTIRDKKVDIGSLRNGTLEFISNIILNEKKESLVPIKCYAAIRLNGYFKLKFLWWFLWRWYNYIDEYTYEELVPAIEAARKKVSEMWLNYVVATTSLTDCKTTLMAMTRAEAEAFRAEQVGVMRGIALARQKEETPSHTSQNPDTSSSDSSK